jgi:hypothetical protein
MILSKAELYRLVMMHAVLSGGSADSYQQDAEAAVTAAEALLNWKPMGRNEEHRGPQRDAWHEPTSIAAGGLAFDQDDPDGPDVPVDPASNETHPPATKTEFWDAYRQALKDCEETNRQPIAIDGGFKYWGQVVGRMSALLWPQVIGQHGMPIDIPRGTAMVTPEDYVEQAAGHKPAILVELDEMKAKYDRCFCALLSIREASQAAFDADPSRTPPHVRGYFKSIGLKCQAAMQEKP